MRTPHLGQKTLAEVAGAAGEGWQSTTFENLNGERIEIPAVCMSPEERRGTSTIRLTGSRYFRCTTLWPTDWKGSRRDRQQCPAGKRLHVQGVSCGGHAISASLVSAVPAEVRREMVQQIFVNRRRSVQVKGLRTDVVTQHERNHMQTFAFVRSSKVMGWRLAV